VAVVWIPSLLQNLTGGADKVVVSGATVAEVIANLEARFPGVKDRLVQGGEIRPHIAVAIDGDVSPEGLEQDVQESSEIHFIPALSGGIDDAPRLHHCSDRLTDSERGVCLTRFRSVSNTFPLKGE
jgi:sulfur-carrier protein